MHLHPALCAALFATSLLSGCSGGGSDDGEEQPYEADSFTVTATNVPAALAPGEPFNVTVTVGGAREADTDHIGAHFGKNTTTAPSTDAYNLPCTHQAGHLPGTYKIQCYAPADTGVFYIRGHARVGATPEEYVSWWSAEHTFTVAGPTGA